MLRYELANIYKNSIFTNHAVAESVTKSCMPKLPEHESQALRLSNVEQLAISRDSAATSPAGLYCG
jgi:hypothetical protein